MRGDTPIPAGATAPDPCFTRYAQTLRASLAVYLMEGVLSIACDYPDSLVGMFCTETYTFVRNFF